MKTTLSKIAAIALIVTGCSAPELADSSGQKFVRVRERKALGNGTSDAELWQRKGDVGTGHPTYIRRLTPAGTPPMFSRTTD